MHSTAEAVNLSQRTQPETFDLMISEQQLQTIIIVNSVFLSSLVALFGIVANVINMIVFYKQGLDTSTNITFFALAVSDISALLLQQVFNVFVNPWLGQADLPIMPSELNHMTAGIPRTVFSRITCLITVYITMERYVCIIFPLHIKQMITQRRTTLAMVAIYLVTWLTVVPLYSTAFIGWKSDSTRNMTVLGIIATPDNDKLTQIVCIILTYCELLLFVAIIVLTVLLIRTLSQMSTWRMTANSSQTKSESMSNKERKTSRLVVLIASILIACNTPSATLFLIVFIVPEFNIVGRFYRLYFATWSIAFLFETLNSSVNIFLYMKMSTKYRETFNKVFERIQK